MTERSSGSEPDTLTYREESANTNGVDPDFAQIALKDLRVQNFRGIEQCAIEFEEDITILVGRNNVGKSRLLRALAIALGAAGPEKDDLTVGGSSPAVIDVTFGPRARTGKEEIFDERSGSRLGSMVQNVADEPAKERFGWRTIIGPSQEGLGVQAVSSVLLYNQITLDWELPEHPLTLSSRQRSIVAADLVQTRRDLVDELTRRGSAIRRVLDDLEIEALARTEIESKLKILGGEILASSKSLGALKAALAVLAQNIDEIGTPNFEPLPIRLEELARSVSINLDTGTGDLPLRFHGSGARSLASLQVQSVLYERRLGRDGPALLPHPITLVEEPESHLHPQAQFELASLLGTMRGQVIVSSHSTHLASVVEPRSLRILRRKERTLFVTDLKPAESDALAQHRARKPSMHVQEMEKLRRLIERPFGELLFASAVVLGDGATERALLPPLLRHALKGRAHGVCVVDPGSMNSEHAKAIVKFAELVGVPWFLFSDSDDVGRKASTELIREFGGNDLSKIVWVPGESVATSKGAATEQMLIDFDSSLCERACETIGYAPGGNILKFMTSKKGAIGSLVASELVALGDWPEDEAARKRHWPAAICELVSKLDKALPQLETKP